MKAWITSIYLLAGSVTAAPYIEIQDTANLAILSPDLQSRDIAKIALPNGLQVLLISDPEADQSAAAMSVEVGSWADPSEYPGMAHFCEHMLFMGTEKYPDSNEFSSLVSTFNGHTNAFTASDKTVYMFSANADGFATILDQFAHFFINPLFNPSNISRELHAVDQEFALMRENDAWRWYMVFKETGNQNHPNSLFSAGNSQTLSKIPQEALKKWHQEHYGANRMRLTVYSPLPIEELKQIVPEIFAPIPKTAKPSVNLAERLSSPGQKGHITSIKPIKTLQQLRISWEIPVAIANDDAKSAELIAYALQRGHEKSLLQKLKSKQLIDDMGVYVHAHMGVDHPFLEAIFSLSDKGLENIEQVISSFFQAIKGFQQSGIQEYLFQEKNTLALQEFQYQSRTNAFELVSNVGSAILHENLASFPRRTLLGTHHDPETIQKVLGALVPQEAMITLLSSQGGAIYNKTEKWLNVPYSVQKIPDTWLTKWEFQETDPEICHPDPNPFVCKNLSLAENQERENTPICFAKSDVGSAFYIRCANYQVPEAIIHLQIRSPLVNLSAKSYVLTSLYLDHLDDLLNATLTEASNANLDYHLGIEKSQIILTLKGFSEKIPLLLGKIVEQMPKNPPTKDQFDLYVSRLTRAYENGAKALPVQQAKELLSSLLIQGKTTKQENLTALRKLSFEDFCAFHKKLFEKTYFEALFSGNLRLKEAENCWLDILHSLSRSPYLSQDHAEIRTLHLPEQEGPFSVSRETKAQGNAAILLLDEGDRSTKLGATHTILGMALQEPFFDTLRTKQKTGYIAQSKSVEVERKLYQYFLVQSNSHQADDLLHRFELFLEEFREDFADRISQEQFETLKQSAMIPLKKGPRNLEEQSSQWRMLTFDEDQDWGFIEKKITALVELSYEEFTAKALEILSRENRKRLAVLFKGQTPDPFVYHPLKSSELSKVASYLPK